MSEAKTLRRKAVSNIVPRDVFREVQLETMQRVSEALANSFGPAGSTTLIRSGMDEKDTGVSAYTKDGHRILSSIKFSKPIEMSILDDLKDITRNTVKTVGDGTTSAVMLSAAIFEAMNTLSAGNKDKYYAECLKEIVKEACKVIAESGRECTLEDIYQIAYISTDGNKEVSQNIYDLYKKFGMNVFIDVGISNTPETTLKTYDGLTIQAGYFDPCFINVEGDSLCTLKNANIYIFEDAINTPEMLNFCYKIIEDNILTPFQKYDEYLKKKDTKKADKALQDVKPTVVFTPSFGRDIRSRMDNILELMSRTQVAGRPPILIVTNITDMDRLSDLAELSGAKMIKNYINPDVQKEDIEKGLAPTMETISKWFGGKADLVSADMNTTKIVNPQLMFNSDGSYSDRYTALLKGLEAQLSQYEETKTELTEMNKLRRRIQSLKCNLVEYLVGGISYTDRDALKDAVEDAVLNCRSATEQGVGRAANYEGYWAIKKLLNEDNGLDKSLLQSILNAYVKVIAAIYHEDPDSFLISEEPYNMMGGDVKVLSSIKTDQVILEAISQIVGLMFRTNQFICSSPSYNTYTDY